MYIYSVSSVSSELCGVKTPDNKRSFSPTALRWVEAVDKFTVPIACPAVEGLRPTPLHMRIHYLVQQVSYEGPNRVESHTQDWP